MCVPFFIYRAHSLIDRHSSRVYLCIIGNGLIRVVVIVLVLLLFRVKHAQQGSKAATYFMVLMLPEASVNNIMEAPLAN